jgi:hypothetical protein
LSVSGAMVYQFVFAVPELIFYRLQNNFSCACYRPYHLACQDSDLPNLYQGNNNLQLNIFKSFSSTQNEDVREHHESQAQLFFFAGSVLVFGRE